MGGPASCLAGGSAPECSPAQAAMRTGRYRFRTGVVTAIVDPMLPVNQLHPNEITIPKRLAGAGCASAMFGKDHLGGGPANTPPGDGDEAPATSVGLDHDDGDRDLPPSRTDQRYADTGSHAQTRLRSP